MKALFVNKKKKLFPSLFEVNESVEVLVENVNDNPPNFAQTHFVLEVNEVSFVSLCAGGKSPWSVY